MKKMKWEKKHSYIGLFLAFVAVIITFLTWQFPKNSPSDDIKTSTILTSMIEDEKIINGDSEGSAFNEDELPTAENQFQPNHIATSSPTPTSVPTLEPSLNLTTEPIITSTPTPTVNLDAHTLLVRDISAYQSNNAILFSSQEQDSFRMAGVSYNNGVTLSSSGWSSNYALFNVSDGQYTMLSGIFGPVDGTTIDRTICILGDGNVLTELMSYSRITPQPFSVNITGINQIRVELTGIGSSDQHALANLVVSR